MSDFLQIKEYKLEEYINKYCNRPHVAYFKLACIGFKYCLKSLRSVGKGIKPGTRPAVAFTLGGGLGDIAFGGLYVKYLKKFLDRFNITLCVFLRCNRSVFEQFFYGQDFLPNCYELNEFNPTNFDLVIELALYIPRVVSSNKSIDSLSDLKSYKDKLVSIENTCGGGVTLDRQINQLMYILGCEKTRVDALDITGDLNIQDDFTLKYHKDGELIFNRYPELLDTPFITISRGVDQSNGYKDSTRLWSVEKYERLIDLIKKDYPDIKIVYLGSSENDCAIIRGVDVNLVGKTTLSELMAILSKAKIHFDMECGMVHIRHFLCRKTSIVLFGPTSPYIKGWSENINIRNNSSCVLPMCEHVILKDQWAKICLKNKSCRGLCVESIQEEFVLKQIKDVMECK